MAFVDPGRGRGPADRLGLAVALCTLPWLRGKGPVEASPAAVKTEIAKLEFLRGMDAHVLDLSVLPAERRCWPSRRPSCLRRWRSCGSSTPAAPASFFGSIEVDIDGELAQLGPIGYRPLRIRDTLFRPHLPLWEDRLGLRR